MPILRSGEPRSPLLPGGTTALAAYRDDAAAHPATLPDDAAGWLMVATQLDHVVGAESPEGRAGVLRRFLAAQGVLTIGPAEQLAEAVVAFVEPIVVAVEDAAWFTLADQMLQSLCTILGSGSALLYGRLVAWRASMARQRGDGGHAAQWYDEVAALAEREDSNALRGRAALGRALLARHRGNFVEVREEAHRVLALEGIPSDVRMAAHSALMVAAVTAGDQGQALTHAWRAFEAADTPMRETEMLINVGQLLVDAGRPRTGLRAFSAAMVRSTSAPRLMLPLLGGAAIAAARALDRQRAPMLVRLLLDQLEGVFASMGGVATLPYAGTSALVEFREALALTGDAVGSERIADRARVLAAAHRYHQLGLVLDAPVVVPCITPVVLDPSAEAVVGYVEALDGAELVGAV